MPSRTLEPRGTTVSLPWVAGCPARTRATNYRALGKSARREIGDYASALPVVRHALAHSARCFRMGFTDLEDREHEARRRAIERAMRQQRRRRKGQPAAAK